MSLRCVVVDPVHVWKLFAREPGDPVFGPMVKTVGHHGETIKGVAHER